MRSDLITGPASASRAPRTSAKRSAFSAHMWLSTATSVTGPIISAVLANGSSVSLQGSRSSPRAPAGEASGRRDLQFGDHQEGVASVADHEAGEPFQRMAS
ncbi:MAG: hypothetical protein U0R64_07390 [Candidatus Nanopelagicales bacterium]